MSRTSGRRTGLTLLIAVVLSCIAVPASAWWRYAEWGKSEDQIVAASRGLAIPYDDRAAVCARISTGSMPKRFMESVEMVGLPASVAFVFDAGGYLVQTIVLFANADFAQVSGMINGIHGQASGEGAGSRTWRDERRGSIITATASGAGTRLVYQPASR